MAGDRTGEPAASWRRSSPAARTVTLLLSLLVLQACDAQTSEPGVPPLVPSHRAAVERLVDWAVVQHLPHEVQRALDHAGERTGMPQWDEGRLRERWVLAYRILEALPERLPEIHVLTVTHSEREGRTLWSLSAVISFGRPGSSRLWMSGELWSGETWLAVEPERWDVLHFLASEYELSWFERPGRHDMTVAERGVVAPDWERWLGALPRALLAAPDSAPAGLTERGAVPASLRPTLDLLAGTEREQLPVEPSAAADCLAALAARDSQPLDLLRHLEVSGTELLGAYQHRGQERLLVLVEATMRRDVGGADGSGGGARQDAADAAPGESADADHALAWWLLERRRHDDGHWQDGDGVSHSDQVASRGFRQPPTALEVLAFVQDCHWFSVGLDSARSVGHHHLHAPTWRRRFGRLPSELAADER